MPRLPLISGRELVKALERLGFEQVSQRGSHVKLRRRSTTCIVPLHPELKKGTLNGVLQQAEVTLTELLEAISH